MLYTTASNTMNKPLYVVNWFQSVAAGTAYSEFGGTSSKFSFASSTSSDGPRRCAEWAAMLHEDARFDRFGRIVRY